MSHQRSEEKFAGLTAPPITDEFLDFVEEEEEIGEDGVEKRTSRTVEIKPQWIAISGETIASNSKNPTTKGLKQEDVNLLFSHIS